MNRLNDLSIVIIGTIVGACMLAGFLIKQWQPTTAEGKVEKEVLEKVVDEILEIEEPKI